MRSERITTSRWFRVLAAGVLLACLLFGWRQARPISAADEVAEVWANVKRSDRYAFSADIQTTDIPLATVENIGRFDRTSSVYLEGENNLADETLQMALWGGGVSVMDRAAAYHVRAADGKVQTRVAGEAWQDGDSQDTGFAPGGDFLAFLDLATNVSMLPQVTGAACTEIIDCSSLTAYTFTIDGAAYADNLRRATQAQLVRTGELPAGTAIALPDHLRHITGSGELWVDSRGLPIRQQVALHIPAAPGADFRTEATLDVTFADYAGDLLAFNWQTPFRQFGRALTNVPLPGPAEAAANAGSVLFALLGMAVIMQPRRRTLVAVNVVLLAALLVTPLAQTVSAQALSTQLAAFNAAQAEAETPQSLPQRNLPAAPRADELVAPAAITSDADADGLADDVDPCPTLADCDGDTLSDKTERLLGTNPYSSDTDFDTVPDNVEVAGFDYNGQHWTGNPRLADSNNDGITDGYEWNPDRWDADGDGTPDLFDLDDDNDGVPDDVDVSRLSASRSDNGAAVTFTQADPLALVIDGLGKDNYTAVTLQIRPTNPDRLWYAFNVLNWPTDWQGNMQDWDGATFFEKCRQEGGTTCAMSPDDNGDLKFVPMLEIATANLNTLPRKADGSLDQTMLDNYGMSVQPDGQGGYLIYAPLNLVEDTLTGGKVAFQTSLLYQAAANWTPQQVRLVWSVYALNEQYADAKAYEDNPNKLAANATIVLQAFYDQFELTGVDVREDRGVDMAIVYEDPALDPDVNEDGALVHFAYGLQDTYLINRDCDFVANGECQSDGQRDLTLDEIVRRWNHPTNGGITERQRWGIGNYLRAEKHHFPALDQAIISAGGPIATAILDTHFAGKSAQIPSLLFVRETKSRALNNDAGTLESQLRRVTSAAELDFTGQPSDQLTGIDATCIANGFQDSTISMYACDAFDHCAAATAPQSVAYVGTNSNTTSPSGTLPNGIERMNLSRSDKRVMLIERPGRTVVDIEVDTVHGKLYWVEDLTAASGFAAEVWWANLDGSQPQRLVDGLVSNADTRVQIAIDVAGNKLYWTAGYQLWWSNLDGSQAAVVYAVPDDPGYANPTVVRQYHAVGDVVFDVGAQRLIISERRSRHLRSASTNGLARNFSLVVEMSPNGSNPTFIYGVAAGCTYADFYDLVGSGVDPTDCVAEDGGPGVQSMAAVDGTLYILARPDNNHWTTSEVVKVTAAGVVEPYAAYPGNNSFQLPSTDAALYVPPAQNALFAAGGTSILRAEQGGEFTLFANFQAQPAATQGIQQRLSSDVSALAVTRVWQAVSRETDLAVSLTTPAEALVNGETGIYEVVVRNDSPLPAQGSTLALSLPGSLIYSGATQSCTHAAGIVTCNVGLIEAFGRRSVGISFTVSVVAPIVVESTVTVASSTTDANPANNSASNNALSAAPTAADLTGIPRLFYKGDTTQWDTVSFLTQPELRPINGAVLGNHVAIDAERGRLYTGDHSVNNGLGNHWLYVQDVDGTNWTFFLDMNPERKLNWSPSSFAVDELTGDIYFTRPRSTVWEEIWRVDENGEHPQLIIGTVLRQRHVAVDSVGRKLYWIGMDSYQRWVQIFRSNLDGSGAELIYRFESGRGVRDFTIDGYNQKLYWIDPEYNDGSLLRADADGRNVTLLQEWLGSSARGIAIRAAQNVLYYASWNQIVALDLDNNSTEAVVTLGDPYYGPSNQNPLFPYSPPPLMDMPQSNLVLGFGDALPTNPCIPADANEPNDTADSATPIGRGVTNGAICRTRAPQQARDEDVYRVSVAAGKQMTATLSNLAGDFYMYARAQGIGVGISSNAGTVDEQIVITNTFGATTDYFITIGAVDYGEWTTPYALDIAIGDPPPPPPPPTDPCAAVDSYDARGIAGNGSAQRATPITVNTIITAALCYQGDTDYYRFDGTVGQILKVDLDPRPADYYIYFYGPDGQFFDGIYAGNDRTYGSNITLNATGTWTVSVWDLNLVPTTNQYELLLTDLGACTGDPYEPNDQFDNMTPIVTRTVTLRGTLCDDGEYPYDGDGFIFESIVAGQRYVVDVVNGTAGMEGWGIGVYPPEGNFLPIGVGRFERVATVDGDLRIGITSNDAAATNEPYEIYVQIDPLPSPTPLPNHWSCTTYNSSDIPQPIDDLTTVGSTVTVPVDGTVTHVGLRDITFRHQGLWNVSFGLQSPAGKLVNLLDFDQYSRFYTWCGDDGAPDYNPVNCQMSIDDGGIAGLIPAPFPNTGDTYRPNLSSFAPFAGESSAGDWTLLISDNWAPEPGDSDFGDTTGDLYGWSLEVCVDNGNTPDPTPTPAPTATPLPQPANGTPPPATPSPSPTPSQTPTAATCAAEADPYEPDNGWQSAILLTDEIAAADGSVAGRTFHTLTDADWMKVALGANVTTHFSAATVSGNTQVALSLYAGDGTTLLTTYTDAISYTATTTGDYYLVARSAAGATSACGESYTVTRRDGDGVQAAPTPVGTPLPPEHNAPVAAGAVLTPTDGSVLTTLDSVTLGIGLMARNEIAGATLYRSGSAVSQYTPARRSIVYDVIWQTPWTPAAAGIYTHSVTVTDTLAGSGSGAVTTLYVDLADPTIAITAEPITNARLNGGIYTLRGTAADDSQIVAVEVQVNGGDWQPAAYADGTWRIALAPQTFPDNDGGTLTLAARVTDIAGRSATTSASVLLDVAEPEPFEFSVAPTTRSVITPGQVSTNLNTTLTWPDVPGAVGYYVGWTASPTPTLGTLAQFNAGGSLNTTHPEASVRYAHVVAVDVNGNERAAGAGPFYFDTAATPDIIADMAFDGWVAAGGKQIERARTAGGGQHTFAGWNADHIRFRWQDTAGAGDLFLYIGTGGSGLTTDLNGNPLPFTADYAVRVTGSTTATLSSIVADQWTEVGTIPATVQTEGVDVLLSFAQLGIANPAATALDVRALAAGQTADEQYVTLPSLGSGIVPGNGIWADVDVTWDVTSLPDPAQPVGAGDALTLTATYSLTGTAGLPALQIDGTLAGGISLSNAPQSATALTAGGDGMLTLSGSIAADGSVTVLANDSYSRPRPLTTLAYTVDSDAPYSVTLTLDAVRAYSNTVSGSVEDASPITLIALEVDDGTRAAVIVNCPQPAITTSWTCDWNAGAVSDGTTYTLRARATDVHGNVSGWSSPLAVTADTTPPVLTLSAATVSALADGILNRSERTLSGTLTDNVQADSVQLCDGGSLTCAGANVAPNASWAIGLPIAHDGVTETLAFTGYDAAGHTTVLTRSVLIDTVRPQIDAITVTAATTADGLQTIATVAASDGNAVAAVSATLLTPSGQTVTLTGAEQSDVWVLYYTPNEPGSYQLLVTAIDAAGNSRRLAAEPVTVTGDPTMVNLRALTSGDIGLGVWSAVGALALGLGIATGTLWRRRRGRAASDGVG